jgi:enoyl-CoA hydratase/carnithine racemase
MTRTNATSGPHWSLEIDAERVAWLTIDQPGASANALSRAVLEELAARLDELAKAPPRGLVIASGKSGFIAGADVREFGQVASAEEAVPHIRAAHALFNRLEELPFPTVAAINGYCLGGGLELALACRYRVCVDDPKAVLGLPEVMLGIHPGFGGTVRAVRQVGVTAAMDMMLTGRSVRPDKALKLGLVDRAVFQVLRQVHRAEVADRDLGVAGVERDLGAQVAAVHRADVLLRRRHGGLLMGWLMFLLLVAALAGTRGSIYTPEERARMRAEFEAWAARKRAASGTHDPRDVFINGRWKRR